MSLALRRKTSSVYRRPLPDEVFFQRVVQVLSRTVSGTDEMGVFRITFSLVYKKVVSTLILALNETITLKQTYILLKVLLN